jgi:hypothetical protein
MNARAIFIGTVSRLGQSLAMVGLLGLLTIGLAQAETAARYKQKIKKNEDGSWTVMVFGAATDPPGRVLGLTQLFAAQHVITNGFGYFRVIESKKTLKCRLDKEFGIVAAGHALVLSRFLGGKSGGNGFIDARSFVAKHRAKLIAEPKAEAKRKVESQNINECIVRHKTVDSLY